ncbi:hypothetical protein SAMN04488131_10713 [Flavobacterium xueshanense]|uniref:Putative auto-transporter adhesin head GIN domain-containing protein n=1 Tax=Flavobacterium xueshanense TaxID=935223 RepID=A0A1I2F4K1_9FLAO|nr:hypothetical protein SAMN04488131_10713 [Flavobacterium xueshanense]
MIIAGRTVNFSSDLKDYNANVDCDFKTKNAKITVSGLGDSTVFYSESLNARVSGSGDVEYKGDPKKKDIKMNGSSTISKS